MFHQLCRATGRLVASKHLQSPLFPVAPIALQKTEPPSIIYDNVHIATVTSDATSSASPRRLIPGTNIPYPPVPENIRKRQELFQKDNDVPVFLKGGPMDAILYRLTMALCLVGLAGVLHTIYGHAIPKKE